MRVVFDDQQDVYSVALSKVESEGALRIDGRRLRPHSSLCLHVYRERLLEHVVWLRPDRYGRYALPHHSFFVGDAAMVKATGEGDVPLKSELIDLEELAYVAITLDRE